MQEDRCDKSPVLSMEDQFIILCPVGDQDIGKSIIILRLDIDGIPDDICQDASQVMSTSSYRRMVGRYTPQYSCDCCYYPGSPRYTLENWSRSVPVQCFMVT